MDVTSLTWEVTQELPYVLLIGTAVILLIKLVKRLGKAFQRETILRTTTKNTKTMIKIIETNLIKWESYQLTMESNDENNSTKQRSWKSNFWDEPDTAITS